MARTSTALIALTDDFTGAEVTVPADTPQYVVSFGPENGDSVTVTVDLAPETVTAINAFIQGDLSFMRELVKGGTMVSLAKEARAWAKAAKNDDGSARFPDLGDQGKLSADVMTAYKEFREAELAKARTIPADASPGGKATK